MENNPSRAPAGGELLRALAPVVELAAQMRPRLVLLVPLASGGCLLCGLVYHQDKQALQSRLQLYYPPGHSELLRATRWTPIPAAPAFVQYTAHVKESFAAMATGLDRKMGQLDFAPTATDEEMRRALVSSGVAFQQQPSENLR